MSMIAGSLLLIFTSEEIGRSSNKIVLRAALLRRQTSNSKTAVLCIVHMLELQLKKGDYESSTIKQ